MLAKSKGYPWRASLTKVARCATCENGSLSSCKKEHQLHYPLYANKHKCPDFKFKPNPFDLPETIFNGCEYPECSECSYNFKNRCSGKRWLPIRKIDDKCEFFHNKDLICKNAIPYSQYCNHLRNNYCRLPPHKRDGDANRGWSWNCPLAHVKGIDYLKCYRSKKGEKNDNRN